MLASLAGSANYAPLPDATLTFNGGCVNQAADAAERRRCCCCSPTLSVELSVHGLSKKEPLASMLLQEK